MKYLQPDFFDAFTCIGSACPDTCCGHWGIALDSVSSEKYLAVPGAFGDKLKANLKKSGNDTYIALNEQGLCPFLNEKKLCEIYINLGEDAMCPVCRIYPRHFASFGDTTFAALQLSCPEVTRMLLERTSPLEFDFREIPDESPVTSESIDWLYYNTYLNAFTLCIDLLQNRTLPLRTRLRLLVIFNTELEKHLADHTDCSPLFEVFSAPDVLLSQSPTFANLLHNPAVNISAFHLFRKNLDRFYNIQNLSSHLDRLALYLKDLPTSDTMFHCFHAEAYDILFEQYCVYFLFMHYFQSYESRQPLKQVASLLYCLNLNQCLLLPLVSDSAAPMPLMDIVNVFTSTAKCLEHSAGNHNLTSLHCLYAENYGYHAEFLLSLF